MKLYYSPGACSLSPHIVLREADRAFELERVDLKTHRTSAGTDFYAINPKGYVPVLQLDGQGSELLTEGPAIVQYVADLVPDHQLAPANGTLGRYRLQEWLNFISTELHKMFSPLFRDDTPDSWRAKLRGTIGERFVFLSDRLADRAYLLGERFTVADAYLYVMLRWADNFHLDLPNWPNLDEYAFRISQRPSVQAALAAEGQLEHHRWKITA
jgi:glutathione S-transferase